MRRALQLLILLAAGCSTAPVHLSDHPFRAGAFAGFQASRSTADWQGVDVEIDDEASPLFGGEMAFAVSNQVELGVRGYTLDGEVEVNTSGFGSRFRSDADVEQWGIDGLLRVYLGEEAAVRPFLQATAGGGKLSFPEGSISPDPEFWRLGLGLGAAFFLTPQLQLDIGAEGGYSRWGIAAQPDDMDFTTTDFRALAVLSLRL